MTRLNGYDLTAGLFLVLLIVAWVINLNLWWKLGVAGMTAITMFLSARERAIQEVRK